ncbi:flagellar basal body P-ring formation chaperone FlgA [Buchnera aphidicola]|uniref:Flagella basal body P-ring formation protein FlgA n=1 Tax=Buchnera aphidicola (Anoecia oenotherae) TaxID=1241833 RepID=A0A4D6XVB3_9GAMM|nr:flagellar basal body P-ring formation chaperone FlgA [Buchnera aphidicola]QCI19387.1 flagella basal body P-ring formation protein FlgA [Buchnera aphidicola (Anoecia oenotherae)]
MNNYKIKSFVCIIIFFISVNNAFSSELSKKIINFLKRNNPIYLNHIDLKILTKKKLCNTPYTPRFILPYHYKKWGNTKILMVTAEKTMQINIYIKIIGYYFLTNKKLKKYSVLNKNNFISKFGNFDCLPQDAILNKNLILNKIINQAMYSHQIITSSTLKPTFVIKKNDKIKVFFEFLNIYISTLGIALNNTCIGDKVKVILYSGNIVTGQLNNDGNVRLLL